MFKIGITFLLAATLITITSGCQKSDPNDENGSQEGCGWGGITIPNTYMFWMDRDFGCGEVTVQVKDKQGNALMMYQPKTTVYETVAPSCSSNAFRTHATIDLSPGHTYTYRATCTGKVWTGSIKVPCEQNKCLTIQLQ